jgi:hypothetical protein
MPPGSVQQCQMAMLVDRREYLVLGRRRRAPDTTEIAGIGLSTTPEDTEAIPLEFDVARHDLPTLEESPWSCHLFDNSFAQPQQAYYGV